VSDERLREIVGNFIYELEDMSAGERRVIRPCSIYQALDQFSQWSYMESFLHSVPLDIPKWQLCLWLSNNIEERVRECDVEDFYAMVCPSAHIENHRLIQELTKCFYPTTPFSEPEEAGSEEEECSDDC
jgi:hypothetical protein